MNRRLISILLIYIASLSLIYGLNYVVQITTNRDEAQLYKPTEHYQISQLYNSESILDFRILGDPIDDPKPH